MKKEVMEAIKQHGDGSKNIEEKTLHYGRQMLRTFEQSNGGPFEPGKLIHLTVAKIMQCLLFGQGSEEDAEACMQVGNNMTKVLLPVGAYMMLDIIPYLRYVVLPVKNAYTTFMNAVTSMNSNFDRYIMTRRKFYVHPNAETVIDHLIKLSLTKSNDTAKNIRDIDIRSMAVDMFVGGMMTISKTLTIILAILVNHPKIQDAIFQDINNIIGKREPKMEDQPFMPFTQAVIFETLRYITLIPLAAPHVTKNDSDLQGYFIPAGTIVFPNLWALHHDERYWECPWEFNPNRWIENGKIVPADHIKKQRLVPFGDGRRQCPAVAFARNRLFILLTMMLQKFKFVAAEGHQRPNHDPSDCTVDFTLNLKPYKLSVIPRY